MENGPYAYNVFHYYTEKKMEDENFPMSREFGFHEGFSFITNLGLHINGRYFLR